MAVFFGEARLARQLRDYRDPPLEEPEEPEPEPKPEPEPEPEPGPKPAISKSAGAA